MRILFILLAFTIMSNGQTTDFKSEQLKYPRVKKAYQEKEKKIQDILKKHGIETPHIYIIAFKNEYVVELWAKNPSEIRYKKITSYEFCSTSANPGA